jgi:phage baseplate assembly protein W
MAESDAEHAFLGTGWAYPLRLTTAGQFSLSSYGQDVAEAIRIILGTNPGERVMRPDFGAGLRAFVDEPLTAATLALVRNRVYEALIDFEPRIDVERVRTSYDPAQKSRLLIEIGYRLRATNTQHNLVYPFYLQEGTPT